MPLQCGDRAAIDREAAAAATPTAATAKATKLASCAVVAGDHAAGLCGVLARQPCASLTMLRHPVSRLVSSLAYCRTLGGADQLCAGRHAAPRGASLVEWARHQRRFLQLQLLFHPPCVRRRRRGVRVAWARRAARMICSA